MRKLWLVAALLLAGVSCPAQNFDLAQNPQSIIKLDGLWRFQPGDAPGGQLAWASPAFDDSSWPLLRADRPWSEQGYPAMSGYAWYRFTVRVPAGAPPLGISLPHIFTGYTLFVDGARVGSYGAAEASIWTVAPNYRSFPLTTVKSPTTRTLHLALRVWESPIWATYAGGGPEAATLVGDAGLITARQQNAELSQKVQNIDLYVDTLLRAIIGVLILGLFLLRTGEREYLWFAALLLFGGADDVVQFLFFSGRLLPVQLFDLLDGLLIAGFWIAGLYFFATVLNAKRGRWFRIALVLTLLSPLATPLYWWGWTSVPVSGALSTLMALPSLIWVLSLLIVRSQRGDSEARLLLLPTLLVHGFYLATNVVNDAYQLGWLPPGHYNYDVLNARLPVGPFDLRLYTLFNMLFLIAMLAFLIRRFSLARRREERLLGEFEAARQVQQILVPETAPTLPGFTIECIYLPAQEVGGDFFQQIPDQQGGVLIVVGDVSGKGLAAAMMVSLLVGTFRTLAQYTQSPGEILSAMNERMLGRSNGGFTTCLVLRIDRDGRMAAANAGHMAPYVDGREISVESSLPLGLTVNTSYPETIYMLAPGIQLTLLTDGVLEAWNQEGGLFGFDRTAAISTQSATKIALAAQTYGQEDDITVLTLQRSLIALG